MYISDYLVGAFFGALITGFLTLAALTYLSRKVTELKKNGEEK